jgi:hypothetical protein
VSAPGADVDAGAADDIADDLAAAALALARRFAAGATMWCVAPAWPAHGRHVAVEFVHPVIMGKRALPAVHVPDGDPVGALRVLARPGDVATVLGPADDGRLLAVLRRAPAWGLTTVWLGAGPRPPGGAADHVLWADTGAAGDLVLRYHLLWELTHVVFEHPGLLTPAEESGEPEVCITCSDEGRLAEVAAVHPDGRADVLAAGRRESVDVSLVDGLHPGSLVLVHAGVAITAITEESGP